MDRMVRTAAITTIKERVAVFHLYMYTINFIILLWETIFKLFMYEHLTITVLPGFHIYIFSFKTYKQFRV